MDTEKINIGILGMGHVGLTTALGFSEFGWKVLGTDQDQGKIARLREGVCTFYEPGLQELLDRHLDTRQFIPDGDVEKVIRNSSVLFVCVGTPQQENGAADLSQVEKVTRTIAANLNGYKLVVEKSTVPVKTADWIKRTLKRFQNGSHDFDVASNPEFLQEGSAVQDVLHPGRIVMGVDSDRARNILLEIYKKVDCPKIVTDLHTAELIKHAANAFLATKISFINMVADLCEATGADINQIARGIGLDPRIGPSFLKAGIGFGGYCLPKDIRAFIHIAEQEGVDLSILRAVEIINRRRIERFLNKIRQALWVVDGKTIAIWGLSFKPDTDDVREAPSLKVVASLLDEGARLRLYDPKAMDNMRRFFPAEGDRLIYCASPYEAASGAHAAAILTEWKELSTLDLVRLREVMAIPVIIDGRNVLDPGRVGAEGFEYFGMGIR